jgi:hypothetical protein
MAKAIKNTSMNNLPGLYSELPQDVVERQKAIDSLKQYVFAYQKKNLLTSDLGTSWCNECFTVNPIIDRVISDIPDVSCARLVTGKCRECGCNAEIRTPYSYRFGVDQFCKAFDEYTVKCLSTQEMLNAIKK